MDNLLLVTGKLGIEECGARLSKELPARVLTASSRKQAMSLLRHGEYQLLVVDESLVESAGEDENDALYRACGSAVSLEVNFAVVGYERLLRSVGAALRRRQMEQAALTQAASNLLQCDLREVVAGLRLHVDLLQRGPGMPAESEPKLQIVSDLLAKLSGRLNLPASAISEHRPAVSEIPPPQRRRADRENFSTNKSTGGASIGAAFAKPAPASGNLQRPSMSASG